MLEHAMLSYIVKCLMSGPEAGKCYSAGEPELERSVPHRAVSTRQYASSAFGPQPCNGNAKV